MNGEGQTSNPVVCPTPQVPPPLGRCGNPPRRLCCRWTASGTLATSDWGFGVYSWTNHGSPWKVSWLLKADQSWWVEYGSIFGMQIEWQPWATPRWSKDIWGQGQGLELASSGFHAAIPDPSTTCGAPLRFEISTTWQKRSKHYRKNHQSAIIFPVQGDGKLEKAKYHQL